MDASRGALLGLTIVACALVYSFRFTSFLHAKDAALCLGACGLALLTVLDGRAGHVGFIRALPLWVFLALGGLRLLFAPVQSSAASVVVMARWMLLLTMAGLAYDLLARDVWRRRIEGALSFSTVAVGLLELLQYAGWMPGMFPTFPGYTQRAYSVFGNQDLCGGYLAFGAPLLVHGFLGQTTRRHTSLAGLAILIPALLVSASRSAWLAAAVGTLVVLLYALESKSIAGTIARRRARIAVLAALVATAILATVLLAPEATVRRWKTSFSAEDQGWRARLHMWESAAHMIEDAPLFGVGLGNYAYWSPRYLGETYAARGNALQDPPELHADHPHSEPMRILAENGLVGAACWIWLIVSAVRRRGPETGGLAAWGVFALFNGPLDSAPHVLAGLLLMQALFARQETEGGLAIVAHGASSRSVRIAVAGSILLVSGFVFWAEVIPSARLRAAQNAHLAGNPAVYLPLYEASTRSLWPDAAAHRDYGIALAEIGRDDQAVREFEQALTGLDTGDIYLSLAILAARNGDPEAAQRWAVECRVRWPSNPEVQQILEEAARPEPGVGASQGTTNP